MFVTELAEQGYINQGWCRVFAYMLMLLFHVGEECWAIAANDVENLVSRVALQPVTKSGQQVAGLLNYYGEPLLTFDVSVILGDQPAPNALSTRIAIVQADAETTVCLILERACERADLSKAVTTLPKNLPGDQSACIRAFWKGTDGGVVRQLAITPFLHVQLTSQLPGQPADQVLGKKTIQSESEYPQFVQVRDQ